MRVALDLHQSIHRHCAGLSHATDVVAAQVDEHHVLGAFLQVAQQLLLEAHVFRRIRTAAAGSGEGPRLDMPSLHLHQLFGRRAHHMPVGTQGEEVHIGRGVDRPQAPINVEGGCPQRLLEALRGNDLEGVPAHDVFARRVDHGVKLALGDVRLPPCSVDARGQGRRRIAGETLLHRIDARYGFAVLLAVGSMDGQQLEPSRYVVEDGQVFGAKERGLRHRRRGASGQRQPLEMTSRLVAQIADRAAVKSRHPSHRRRLLAGHRCQRREGTSITQGERAGVDPDERVAGEALAAFHAFEQESGFVRRTQKGVGANRGQHVGEDFPIHGNQCVVGGQRPSFLSVWCAAGKARSGCASRAE